MYFRYFLIRLLSRNYYSIEHLHEFLRTTTWRKINNFETITFLDEKFFMHKNYLTNENAKCNYTLGQEFGQTDIIWALDNFVATSQFTNDFSKFTELFNPSYIWTLVG